MKEIQIAMDHETVLSFATLLSLNLLEVEEMISKSEIQTYFGLKSVSN